MSSVVVVKDLSRPNACGSFLDQGLHPCPPLWQVDSALKHSGSPSWTCVNLPVHLVFGSGITFCVGTRLSKSGRQWVLRQGCQRGSASQVKKKDQGLRG